MYTSFFNLKSFDYSNFRISVNSDDTSRPVDIHLIISLITLRYAFTDFESNNFLRHSFISSVN